MSDIDCSLSSSDCDVDVVGGFTGGGACVCVVGVVAVVVSLNVPLWWWSCVFECGASVVVGCGLINRVCDCGISGGGLIDSGGCVCVLGLLVLVVRPSPPL